jgi:transposase-like protein
MKPTRDQIAKAFRFTNSTHEVAIILGVKRDTLSHWLQEYELTRQPIPLEAKLLMVELYYDTGEDKLKPSQILRKFQQEIPHLSKAMLQAIVKPRPKGKGAQSQLATKEEAAAFHMRNSE